VECGTWSRPRSAARRPFDSEWPVVYMALGRLFGEYHVTDNVPYMSYVMATVYLYQQQNAAQRCAP
jgi:hypothetical protein